MSDMEYTGSDQQIVEHEELADDFAKVAADDEQRRKLQDIELLGGSKDRLNCQADVVTWQSLGRGDQQKTSPTTIKRAKAVSAMNVAAAGSKTLSARMRK